MGLRVYFSSHSYTGPDECSILYGDAQVVSLADYRFNYEEKSITPSLMNTAKG